jgi:hypothetical protein
LHRPLDRAGELFVAVALLVYDLLGKTLVPS